MVIGLVSRPGLCLTVYNLVDPMRQAQAKERQLDTSIHRAEDNFTTLCFPCHGEKGQGAVVPSDPPRRGAAAQPGPVLGQGPRRGQEEYDLIFKTIQRGRAGTPMPLGTDRWRDPLRSRSTN